MYISFFKLSFVGLILHATFSCSTPIPRAPIPKASNTNSSLERSIHYSKKLYTLENNQFKRYFLKHRINHVRESNHGFAYRILSENKHQKQPQIGSQVTLYGTVTTLKGDTLDRYTADHPLIFKIDKEDQIIGLHEGVKLMTKSSVYEFYFLSYHAFGFHGNNKTIKPLTPLIYNLKLITFK